jgi:hypothetical protein|tara:strand:+ start:1210 stop:1398 length:189 start_codon:yes stop_codon:yes gene_type:complete
MMDRLEKLVRLADKCMARWHETKKAKYQKRGHVLFDEAQLIIQRKYKIRHGEAHTKLMEYKY